ncbi:MAG TPA: glycogen synthase GlgA [Thermoanaerobaculia bacterium]|nr:glycogen synthase GlgA [Thermoanaerobaculia bacterium]
MRVLFASAEVAPFAKTGGLGDVCGALPQALRKLGHEITVFSPFYREARVYCERRDIPLENLGQGLLSWGTISGEFRVLRATMPGSDVPILFIENDTLFDRPGLYWGRDDGVDDNLERFTFFCRAVITVAERIGLSFDLVHAHDWQTALLPIYLRSALRGTDSFRATSSIYTIHNLNYQGRYGADRFPVLGLDDRFWSPAALEYFGDLVLMKGGIVFADRVTTVSPTYALEIQTPEFGAGFDGLLRSRADSLTGILNGIDVEEWNPASDPHLASPFHADDLKGKVACKRALRKEAGLAPTPRAPVLAAISRLVEQKGFDLLVPLIPRIVAAGFQIVILGTGEHELESALAGYEETFPGQVRVWTRFDTPLAHRIIAGSDAIVIPSRYEPCGLNQLYSFRYGTVPLVRLTGGLADTVTPWDGSNASVATGFGFEHASSAALWQSILVSRTAWSDRRLWRRIQKNGMRKDFSWDASAAEYDRLYRSTRL